MSRWPIRVTATRPDADDRRATRPDADDRRAARRSGVIVAAALGALAMTALAGCGIRGTAVPVDAGAAPSRASCDAPEGKPTTRPAVRGSATVYLECLSQVQPVDRGERPAGASMSTDPAQVARALLAELRQRPSAAERKAGYGTEVRAGLTVSGPAKGDPVEALRMSSRPEELPSTALAQIICTYASSPATSDADRQVVLGGPDHDDPLRRYACTEALREHPESALSSGTPLS
ncbi:hypothetical protein LRS74_19830 [Streptomyces sp. LX-29]|uniref:hypothetical protein n=1 Tax=Streptomyces sp. LX-29 TaxID=2900152 RepID=UPI00240D5D6B|nr:hypothetical protein [Streptomyces sp. LX-29]WFB09042.1 hypothetical protein LRS74_19830 [Streptomyces sp. LX-29]